LPEFACTTHQTTFAAARSTDHLTSRPLLYLVYLLPQCTAFTHCVLAAVLGVVTTHLPQFSSLLPPRFYAFLRWTKTSPLHAHTTPRTTFIRRRAGHGAHCCTRLRAVHFACRYCRCLPPYTAKRTWLPRLLHLSLLLRHCLPPFCLPLSRICHGSCPSLFAPPVPPVLLRAHTCLPGALRPPRVLLTFACRTCALPRLAPHTPPIALFCHRHHASCLPLPAHLLDGRDGTYMLLTPVFCLSTALGFHGRCVAVRSHKSARGWHVAAPAAGHLLRALYYTFEQPFAEGVLRQPARCRAPLIFLSPFRRADRCYKLRLRGRAPRLWISSTAII